MIRTLSEIAAVVSIVFAAIPASAQPTDNPPTEAIVVPKCDNVTMTTATAADMPQLIADIECYAKRMVSAADSQARRVAAAARIAAEATANPAPTGPVATVQEHSYAELVKIAPNYDRASMLVKAHNTGAIPKSAAPDVLGAFRLICGVSHLSYDDPVVYPGQPGKSHLHLFFGNTLADASSSYASLRTTGLSTCGDLNRSAYWMPGLLDGKGHVILPDYATVYYKRRPDSDPLCHSENVECIGLPRGLHYVFGRSMAGGIPPEDHTDPVNFTCSSPSISTHDFAEIQAKCANGSQVVVQIAANNCWDGSLDSADHRAHMAQMYYVNGKQVCPADHKLQTPDFHFNVSWTMRDEMRQAKFSSDIMAGEPAGSTVHADWFGAWDDATLDAWLTNCIDGFKNASGGDLCDGTQIKGAAQPSYGFHNPNPVVDVPAPGTTELLG